MAPTTCKLCDLAPSVPSLAFIAHVTGGSSPNSAAPLLGVPDPGIPASAHSDDFEMEGAVHGDASDHGPARPHRGPGPPPPPLPPRSSSLLTLAVRNSSTRCCLIGNGTRMKKSRCAWPSAAGVSSPPPSPAAVLAVGLSPAAGPRSAVPAVNPVGVHPHARLQRCADAPGCACTVIVFRCPGENPRSRPAHSVVGALAALRYERSAAGTVLFAQGDPGSALCILLEGGVAAAAGRTDTLPPPDARVDCRAAQQVLTRSPAARWRYRWPSTGPTSGWRT